MSPTDDLKWLRGGRRLIRMLASAGLFFLLLLAAGSGPRAEGTGADAFLRFTAGGHVLGFGKSALYVASANHMVKVDLAGGRAVAPAMEEGAVSGAGGASGKAPPLSRVAYSEVWDGVTVIYEKQDDAILESSYEIKAGAGRKALEQIRLHYNRPVRLDEQGDLIIPCKTGAMRERAPVAWQETGSGRKYVTAAYRLMSEHEVGFEVGDYEGGLPLMIDPTMTWNTFLGGNDTDQGYGIAVDGTGNVYVVGDSNDTWGSPVRAFQGNGDAFVTKLDSSGNLLWSTFLGGDDFDEGFGIAVDGNLTANVYVTGYSWAGWGEPVQGFSDYSNAFAARLASNGAVVWNTFLGGGEATTYGQAIAVDSNATANVYVTGWSDASWGPSPVRPYTGLDDAFAARLGSTGGLVWNTFLGGSGQDAGYGIAVDQNGNVYVAGDSNTTWSEVPVRPFSAGADAFAAKLDSSGSLTWYTFLGGSGEDHGTVIAVDGNATANAYVAGFSYASWGSPVNAYSGDVDAFAARLSSNGGLLWNSFLGSESYDDGLGIAVDRDGSVLVTGTSTASWGSPLRAFSNADNPSAHDAFVAKLSSSGWLTWNTFLGGELATTYGTAVTVDTITNVYVTGYSDYTWGSPVRAHYPYDPNSSTLDDAFVAKLPSTPTLVEVVSFRAKAGRDYIELTWETASEVRNVGFFLWRKGSGERSSARISGFIPSESLFTLGAKYTYKDIDVLPGVTYRYRLEDVDIHDGRSFHGPVAATIGDIVTVAPKQGKKVPVRPRPRFRWTSEYFDRFRLEFSASPGFESKQVVAIPLPKTGVAAAKTPWLTAQSYTPLAREWKAINRLGSGGGRVYWRVEGKNKLGATFRSKASHFSLDLGPASQ